MNDSYWQNSGPAGGRIMPAPPTILRCSLLVLIMVLAAGIAPADDISGKTAAVPPQWGKKTVTAFEHSTSCSICHQHIFEQHAKSMHAKSFDNLVFRKIYFDVLLKRSGQEENLAEEMKGCIACHSPVTFLRTGGKVSTKEQVNPELSGVECDLCHRITGYKGDEPGNGNYEAVPGTQKFGPFQRETDWHHVYSELQTKSEVCAICHNRVNRFGLEIISTYSEWKASRYAKEGIQCQDCHMNAKGFLTAGKAVFESGRASQNTLAGSPARSKLYTHRFPGAHSETQVKGAINLYMQVDSAALVPGEEAVISVLVDNSKSGHKLPTGTAELRVVYLDLYLQDGETIIHLPASSPNDELYDVSGKSGVDAEFLGEHFPQGRRLYRAVCVDSGGSQTFFSHDAAKIVFDNRLQADEVRKEFFTFSVPKDIGPEFAVVAKLYYLRYPDPFAEKIGVSRVKSVELAEVRKEIVLGDKTE
ncbi:MAG: multiheme c-type cytochrome [Thermodesulfobacteriota bacterium]